MGHKPLNEQVIVITGASSGIGLATARMAARRGARVVLAARSEDVLADIAAEFGTRATYVVADVGRREDVQAIADHAVATFGGFDTWVNVAGLTVYGPLRKIAIEDHERLIQTNLWGTVYGSLIAAEHLRGRGGAIVNVGSIASDLAFPFQGLYATSKHAVKGFTDTLRMELIAEGAPVSVTLVKPASIDTPLPNRARNYMDREPTLPPPIYPRRRSPTRSCTPRSIRSGTSSWVAAASSSSWARSSRRGPTMSLHRPSSPSRSGPNRRGTRRERCTHRRGPAVNGAIRRSTSCAAAPIPVRPCTRSRRPGSLRAWPRRRPWCWEERAPGADPEIGRRDDPSRRQAASWPA
ncbi:hypothetical protein MSPGM_00200 [Methylorubrum sp. GM97]|nr:hypothetical protein MSPGM_00200 [Methylorubrum sp. GM97]